MKFPLKFTKDFSIEDANGTVICPCIIYKSDVYHLEEQRKNGEQLVEAINNREGFFFDGKDWKKLEEIAMQPQLAPTTIEGTIVVNDSGNGNGKWKGKVRNPWGRGGRPR